MGQVIVRKLREDVIEFFRRRAKANGNSLEQELRDALTHMASPDQATIFQEIDRIHRDHAPAKLPKGRAPLGVELIRQDRDAR
jgi:plasmid stability protein